MIDKQESTSPKERTKDEIREDIDEGVDDKEVYSEPGRDKLVEEGEMGTWEEGFMEGAEGRGQMTSCARCGKLLSQEKDEVFERKINGKKMFFCSKEHAEKGPRD
ncbi:hypothetical protein KY345_00175 [Candidatus Woesearchaeota archaeon]|nr:hypothetical protein [Candidatus Woesearchaeota archaeon]